VVCILRFVDSPLRAIRHKHIHSLVTSPALEAGSGSCGQGLEVSLSCSQELVMRLYPESLEFELSR